MSTESGNGIQVHLSVTFLLKNNFPITINLESPGANKKFKDN